MFGILKQWWPGALIQWVFTGPPRPTSTDKIPPLAMSYAQAMAEMTGQPLDEVLQSEPVQKYIKRVRGE